MNETEFTRALEAKGYTDIHAVTRNIAGQAGFGFTAVDPRGRVVRHAVWRPSGVTEAYAELLKIAS